MKTFIALAVSIVLVSIFFCPMAMAAPPIPSDVQMVQPDPSLPKEIAGFWGKWEGGDSLTKQMFFLIIEKIDEERASGYTWRSSTPSNPAVAGWERWEAKIMKEYGKYKLWRSVRFGQSGFINLEWTLKGEYLDSSSPRGSGARYTRVP